MKGIIFGYLNNDHKSFIKLCEVDESFEEKLIKLDKAFPDWKLRVNITITKDGEFRNTYEKVIDAEREIKDILDELNSLEKLQEIQLWDIEVYDKLYGMYDDLKDLTIIEINGKKKRILFTKELSIHKFDEIEFFILEEEVHSDKIKVIAYATISEGFYPHVLFLPIADLSENSKKEYELIKNYIETGNILLSEDGQEIINEKEIKALINQWNYMTDHDYYISEHGNPDWRNYIYHSIYTTSHIENVILNTTNVKGLNIEVVSVVLISE